MQTGRDTNKFSDIQGFERSANGLIYLTQNTNAFFSVKVDHKIDLGSHTLFVGEVVEGKALSNAPSCTYAHYHKSIKPKK